LRFIVRLRLKFQFQPGAGTRDEMQVAFSGSRVQSQVNPVKL